MGGPLAPAQQLASRAWRMATEPLYRNAFLIMLASVIGSGLGFFFWIAAGRLYDVNDVGYAVALFQTLTFLAGLAHLGLGTATLRYLPESADKPTLVNSAATLVGLAALALAAVFLVGVTVFAPNLAFIQANPAYPFVILGTTLAVALTTIYDQASYAMRRADVLTWRTLLTSAGKIPLIVAFAFMVLTSGRLGIFLALALSFVAGVLLEALFLLPRVLPGFHAKPQIVMRTLRPLFRFSAGNYVANSIGSAGALLLPVLILDVAGPGSAPQVAYYYVASVVAALLNIIPGAVFTSFYAEASQVAAANRHADERRAMALSVALLLPGIAVLWFFSETMLLWFGDPRYAAGAVGVLRILIFASIPVFLNSVLTTRVRIRKKSAPLIVGSAISTGVILGLGVFLLKANGIDGLAVAAVLGSAAATPWYYAVARKSFRDEEAAPPAEPSDTP